jgi:hypothetical protein
MLLEKESSEGHRKTHKDLAGILHKESTSVEKAWDNAVDWAFLCYYTPYSDSAVHTEGVSLDVVADVHSFLVGAGTYLSENQSGDGSDFGGGETALAFLAYRQVQTVPQCQSY